MGGQDPRLLEAVQYDAWYDEHPTAYQTELEAVRQLLPMEGTGLEVGAGTGRFAGPLGLVGLDPDPARLGLARSRGVEAVRGVAEALPFRDACLDQVLFFTTLCFVQDPRRALEEAARVLAPGGSVLVAGIDPETELGRAYQARQGKSRSLRGARFHCVEAVRTWMHDAGFPETACWQILAGGPREPASVEAPRPGHGEGGVYLLCAVRGG